MHIFFDGPVVQRNKLQSNQSINLSLLLFLALSAHLFKCCCWSSLVKPSELPKFNVLYDLVLFFYIHFFLFFFADELMRYSEQRQYHKVAEWLESCPHEISTKVSLKNTFYRPRLSVIFVDGWRRFLGPNILFVWT